MPLKTALTAECLDTAVTVQAGVVCRDPKLGQLRGGFVMLVQSLQSHSDSPERICGITLLRNTMFGTFLMQKSQAD